MDYRQAIALAKKGKEEGFQFLYESTYKSKYYLALKYLKDEQAAQDILQDAYIKAFAKLDTLEKPETFPAWLGVIVGNLAKNKLQKKNPLLFSDVAVNEENEFFEYEIEDEKTDSQPELLYSKQETQQLVHEMINALSAEQRICILMYEIEGIPIKEIASALGCSENTVKSRLSYGRKNLKKKAEELQKKGYKLYSLSALPLFLMLLGKEESILLADGTLKTAQIQAAEQILSHTGAEVASASQSVLETTKNLTMETVKKVFFHSVVEKASVALVGIALVGGIAGTVYYTSMQSDEPTSKPSTETSSVISSESEISEEPEVSQETSQPQVQELTEEDYPDLIAGNLTKAEMEYVLSYGPTEISDQGLGETDYVYILNTLCQGPEGSGMATEDQKSLIESYGYNSQYASGYSVEDVNRLFLSFTDYQFTQENHGANEGNIKVEGDILYFFPATINFTAETNITSAEHTDEQITLYFTYDRHLYDQGQQKDTHSDKKAILRPNAEGKYQIVKIEEAEIVSEEESSQEQSSSAPVEETSVEEIYADILDSVKNAEQGYQFTNGLDYTGKLKYFYQDLNQDGIKDLVVGAECTQGAFMAMDCRFYSCKEENGNYKPVEVTGSQIVMTLCLPQDGYGLFHLNLSRGTGMYECSRITIENNTIKLTDLPEYRFQLGDAEQKQFMEENPRAEWIDLV